MSEGVEVVAFSPGDAAHVEGLAALFAACACPCYCRYWHFPGDKNGWLERCFVDDGKNEAELREAAARGSDEASGVVAWEGGRLVGWAKVAPGGVLRKFYEQRYYRGLGVLRGRPTEGVWALGCMLIHPERRRRGVASSLARGAVALARARGARAIEAFPRRTEGAVSDEEHWMGPERALLDAGFSPVDATPPYPVYRITLG